MNKLISNYTQSFGKQALMTCDIKELNTNDKKSATLYKLNPENPSDIKDVFYSKHTGCIARDFEKAYYASYPQKEFYMLQNNSTGEVVSCAQTSHHYRPSALSQSGQYTLIEEAKENNKYKNAIEPLLAYITKSASDKFDESVFTAFDENTIKGLSDSSFSKADTGEYFISRKNFVPFIKNTEKACNIEYIV